MKWKQKIFFLQVSTEYALKHINYNYSIEFHPISKKLILYEFSFFEFLLKILNHYLVEVNRMKIFFCSRILTQIRNFIFIGNDSLFYNCLFGKTWIRLIIPERHIFEGLMCNPPFMCNKTLRCCNIVPSSLYVWPI